MVVSYGEASRPALPVLYALAGPALSRFILRRQKIFLALMESGAHKRGAQSSAKGDST